jgi:hypothetical protein
MKNLILLIIFVLPMALFSAAPRCLDGLVVSLVDCNGKVVKTGKLNSQGKVTLDGADPDCAWDVKLSNNGKSIDLGVNKKKKRIDKSSPLMFKAKISDYKDGNDLKLRKKPGRTSSKVSGGNSGLATGKRGAATETNHNTVRTNKKSGRVDEDDDDDGVLTEMASKTVDNDCDSDVGISVTSKGNGRVEIKVTKTK